MDQILSAITDADLMVLLKSSPVIAERLKNMNKTQAKRLYVDEKHNRAITQLSSKSKYVDGKWSTHVYVNGKRKVVRADTVDEIYDQLYDFYRGLDEKPKTYEDVFEKYVEYKHLKGRAEATIKEYRRYHEFIDEKIRSKSIVCNSEDELRLWLVNVYLKRKPKKEALKKMIQLFSNPMRDILVEDYTRFCDQTTKTNEDHSFSEKDIQKLRDYCLEHLSNPHSIVMLVAMETGMRAGELAALKKIDVGEDFIHVHRQQTRIPKTENTERLSFTNVDFTKNERSNPKGGRPVPITPRCREALNIALDYPGEFEFLFHHRNGNQIIKDSYEEYLRRVCQRLGIEISHNHAFRVAFNARLIEAGVDGIERCLVLGHSMQTNERCYSFSDKRKAESVKNKLLAMQMA